MPPTVQLHRLRHGRWWNLLPGSFCNQGIVLLPQIPDPLVVLFPFFNHVSVRKEFANLSEKGLAGKLSVSVAATIYYLHGGPGRDTQIFCWYGTGHADILLVVFVLFACV